MQVSILHSIFPVKEEGIFHTKKSTDNVPWHEVVQGTRVLALFL
jgi:hypothetical protein